MQNENEEEALDGPGIYIVALLLAAAPLITVGVWAFRSGGPVQSAECSAPEAKRCEVEADCVAVQVGPCKMDSVAHDYADACRNVEEPEEPVGTFRRASPCGTDWDNNHAECRNGRCVLAPGF